MPSRGQLRIFLGYASGVGKTYAMLQAAHQRLREGRDVVTGYVETHGRPDTARLLEGLERAPLLQVQVQDVKLDQLHLDWLLERKPQLVLIDEMAHCNAPGLRHPKRAQDVEELLVAGIDVYTTLNVQHIESLNDSVETITGVRVRDTLPDAALAEADEISLVDLPPEELLQRIGSPHESFFRPGNLTALREMALRTAATQVEAEMLQYMEQRAISGPWPASERLLVCVGPSPLSEKLVRAARRLATALNAQWYAVSVDLVSSPLDEEGQERLQKHLRLAENLQARTVTLRG